MFWRTRQLPRMLLLAGLVWSAAANLVQGIQERQRPEQPAARRWLPGLFLGLATGVVAGLLFAPQKGDQTRTFVRERWTEYTKDLPEATSEMMESARELGGRVTSVISTQMTRARGRATEERSAKD